MLELLPSPEQRKEIRLFDATLENARILNIFLGILYSRPLPSDIITYLISMPTVVSLALKYDCKPTLFMISMILRGMIGEPKGHPFWIFCAAAKANDVETCRRAIARSGRWAWLWPEEMKDDEGKKAEARRNRKAADPVYRASVLDITAMSYSHYTMLPPKFAHALTCASRVSPIDPSTANWDAIAKEFARLLTGSEFTSIYSRP